MTTVVTCFLRDGGTVALVQEDESAPWDAVSGHPDEESTEEAARRIAREATDDGAATLVRTGRSLSVEDRMVHPFLFDVSAPLAVEGSVEWVHPPEIRRRDAVPGLWRAYDAVAPTVRTITADDERGAASLSIRALEVLRDRAATVAGEDGGDGWDELADLARRLRRARPEMVVLGNRIDRAMAGAAEEDARAVETAATEGIRRALSAEAEAVEAAAGRVSGATVLTLSRSGTVLESLRAGDPAAVFVAESRPAREGVDLAESLAGTTPVTVHTDAAVADVLARKPVDLVLVGADAITPEGGVLNKTGTRTAAIAAAHEGVPVCVAATTDKVSTDPVQAEATAGGDLYDGPAVDVYDPLFDETPPELVTAILSERGRLDPDDVAGIAAEHRERAGWDALAETETERERSHDVGDRGE